MGFITISDSISEFVLDHPFVSMVGIWGVATGVAIGAVALATPHLKQGYDAVVRDFSPNQASVAQLQQAVVPPIEEDYILPENIRHEDLNKDGTPETSVVTSDGDWLC